MIESSRPSIQIDLNEFKLHLHLKSRAQLTFHFDSPSRRFYLSVIALVVNEMKKLGKIKSIHLQVHLDLLVVLNETIGGAAGSSDKDNLLHRIYRKWKDALPNLEEAPLFKVLGRKKEEGDAAIGKIYAFTDVEKDGWANLFEYKGSNENVRLKFAIDKIGVGLNETSIIFGDSLNGHAWDRFISSLKEMEKEEFEPEEEKRLPEPAPISFPLPQMEKSARLKHNQWVLLIAAFGILAVALVIWKTLLSPAPIQVASVHRMKHPLPDKPSVAVLPFVNMSDDPGQEFFSDGLTEEITTTLSKNPNLFVVSRNSAFTYKGKPVRVGQVAEELGVGYVVEGSVRRAGEKVRINVQLIDAIKGHHLWAEKYDGIIGDVFALQDQITEKIVSALGVKLSASEKEWGSENGTKNVAAYDAFLRGYGHYLRFTPEDSAKAVASFQKAVELDPNFGRAYAALAAVYYEASMMPALFKGLGVSWHEARARSIQYLPKATKDPITHTVRSRMYLFRRQYQESILELERGLALDPNDPACHLHMGYALTLAGKPRDGVEYLKKGMRLDPHNPARYLTFLGVAHFCMGEMQEAVALVEKAMRLNPENAPSWRAWLASFCALIGRVQEARDLIETWKKEKYDSPGVINLRYFMNSIPFQEQAIAERFAQGLLKAGVPPAKIPGGFFPAFKENQLTGEEIKSLLFGSAITGYVFYPQQFWINYRKNGEVTYDGPSIAGGPSSDIGKSRIDGDTICTRYQKRFWGVESCATAFRYPGGSYEGKDEYFLCNDFGFSTFSVVR
jgi:adenylate cyclase